MAAGPLLSLQFLTDRNKNKLLNDFIKCILHNHITGTGEPLMFACFLPILNWQLYCYFVVSHHGNICTFLLGK